MTRHHMYCMTVTAWSILAVASSSDGHSPSSDNDLASVPLDAARRVWRLSTSDKAEDDAKALELIDGLDLDPTDDGDLVVALLRSRLYFRSGQPAKARVGFLRLIDSRAVSPEGILGLMELRKEPLVRLELRRRMADVLPLSRWATTANAVENGDRGFEHPPRPNIPAVDRRMCVTIADAFDRAGLHNEAWMAYVEAAYLTSPSWIADPVADGRWFSQDTAILWRGAAINAWKAGERSLAVEYLTKFGIFGSESQFKEAKEIYEKWTNGEDEDAEPPPSREQKRKALEEVLRLYAEMNAHPRCFTLIKAHREVLDNPDELFAKYLEQWKAVLKSYSQWVEGVVYGVKLTPDLDPTTIKIPWACSPEAVKEAHAKVAKLLGETK